VGWYTALSKIGPCKPIVPASVRVVGMQETLKSIRLAHNVLLALCAAILGFALSPNETSHYDELSRALEKFQTILNVNDTQWNSHLDEVIERQTQFSQKLKAALDSLGIKEPTKIRQSALVPVEYSARFIVQQKGSTLQQIMNAFEGEANAKVFVPDNFQAEIQTWLQPFRGMDAELFAVRLSGVQGAGRPALECYWDLKIPSQTYAANQSRIETDMQQLTIPPRVTNSGDYVTVDVDARIHGDYAPVEGETFGRFLVASSRANSSANESKDPKSPVPNVVMEATELRSMDIPQALKYVEEKRKELLEKQNVSLLGVKVSAGIATVLGPLATLVVTLGLLSYLLNALRLASRSAADAVFPWIGLFPDLLSRTLTLSSIVVLPPLVDSLLLRRVWGATWPTWGIGLALAMLTGVVACFCWLKTVRLRAALSTNGAKTTSHHHRPKGGSEQFSGSRTE